LNTYFDCFPNQVFVENVLFWSQNCLKTLQVFIDLFLFLLLKYLLILLLKESNNNNLNERLLAFEILHKIFENLNNSSKQLLLSIIPQFVETVLRKSSFDSELIISIKCLNSCLNSFSSTLASKRHSIEKFLLDCLTNISISQKEKIRVFIHSFYLFI
jgi:hypothetical protein